jgi:glycosyltransferase involved in cell wall biosynthesis
VLEIEEAEYAEASSLLCPSDFVVKTFLDQGFPREKLLRHIYGYDPTQFFPPTVPKRADGGLTVLFVGVCAVRKGLHFALDAWLRSPASRDGEFLIAGGFVKSYHDKLQPLLRKPGVCVLGHRDDVAELMRTSDIVVLPSIEEGFGLVCTEAMASGCVPLVSDACTDLCRHMDNALVHRAGDVAELARHFAMLHDDRSLLCRLRRHALRTAPSVTWEVAGRRLLDAYLSAIAVSQGRA